MRVFVGIQISDEIKREIIDWQKVHSEFPVRWIEGKNLHVTLVPPWYEEDIGSIIEKLKSIQTSRFEIQFEKIFFGPPREPRMIWVSGKVIQELLNLQKNLYSVLRKTPEKREF